VSLLESSEQTEFAPEGLLEKFLVEEIATLFWKLGITEGLETRNFRFVKMCGIRWKVSFIANLNFPSGIFRLIEAGTVSG
jgi:hypothetical protein